MKELSLAGALWFLFWGIAGLYSSYKWAQFAWRSDHRRRVAGSHALRMFKFLCVCAGLGSAFGLFIGLRGLLYLYLF